MPEPQTIFAADRDADPSPPAAHPAQTWSHQGNGNYRIGKPATPTYTLASELAHLDQGSASEQPAPVTAESTPAPKPSPTPASVKLEGNELDDTIESKGKYVIWGIIIVALAVVVMNT